LVVVYDCRDEEVCMKKEKKLTLSKETLRTLDEQELSMVVGGAQSGSNVPPVANGCPASKGPGNSCH
jgi:natural product precursor